MFSKSTIAPALAALAAAAVLTLGLSAGAASASLAQRPPSSGGDTGGGYSAMAGFHADAVTQTITEGAQPPSGGSGDGGGGLDGLDVLTPLAVPM
jgi:hypothetical protein